MLKDVSQTLLDKQTSKRRRARKSTESTTTKQAAVPKPPAAAKSARVGGAKFVLKAVIPNVFVGAGPRDASTPACR